MIQRIRRLGVAQMAKVMGALYFLLGILIAALMGLFGSMFQTAGDESAMLFGGGAFLIALPILYGVIGVVAVVASLQCRTEHTRPQIAHSCSTVCGFAIICEIISPRSSI